MKTNFGRVMGLLALRYRDREAIVNVERGRRQRRKLAKLDFERLLPYHGDFLGEGAAATLRRDLGYE